jgi:hypothetical protein
MQAAVEASAGWATYSQVVDRESASETLAARMAAGAEKAAQEQAAKDAGKDAAKKTGRPAPEPKAAKPQDTTFEKVVKSSTFQYAVKYAAREAVRGMFGVGRR